MTAVVPRQANDEDIAHVQELVRAGVVGTWHYRWPELQATAAHLGLTPENAVYRAHNSRWPTNEPDDTHLTPADAIREAGTR